MDYEINEGFCIENDSMADWAIQKVREEEGERDRLIAIANAKIEDLNRTIEELEEKCENKTSFLKGHLERYFATVPHKETKTQETYKLLSGSLVMKKPSVKITHNDECLIDWLEQNDMSEYVKLKKSVDWAEYKKKLIINEEGQVVDSNLGVIIDPEACSIESVDSSFSVKF